jgi:ArsR family transcriptional regulator, cadmium/lead-responsive transcriptional repressor
LAPPDAHARITGDEVVPGGSYQLILISSPVLMSAVLESAPFRLPVEPSPVDLVAKYFRTLGDPTRLRILEFVIERERSVGEIVDALGLQQSKVSNHLACLRWCGFVATRREHRTVYYRVADPRVAAVIATGRSLLEDNAEHVAACRRVGGSC